MTLIVEPKPRVILGAIGRAGHGKRTMVAAITHVLAKQGNSRPWTWDDVNRTEKPGWTTIHDTAIEFETATRHYYHQEVTPKYGDFVRHLFSEDTADSAILVMSLADGMAGDNRDALLLAREFGVPSVVVYLNKADLVDDPDLIGVAKLEVRDLLNQCGYAGDDAPIIVGSALKALEGDPSDIGAPSIQRLIDALDATVPVRPRDPIETLLMTIDQVHGESAEGVLVHGRIGRGSLVVGESVEIVGLRDSTKLATVASIDRNGHTYKSLGAGGDPNVLLQNASRADLEPGQVLTTPGSTKAHTKVKVIAYFVDKKEHERSSSIRADYRPEYWFGRWKVSGTFDFIDGVPSVSPGGVARGICAFERPIPAEIGYRFVIIQAERSVGIGVVQELL